MIQHINIECFRQKIYKHYTCDRHIYKKQFTLI